MLGLLELPEDEVPDENIWHHSRRLEEWFEAVKQRREHGMQPIEADDAEMATNEYARQFLGG